MLTYNESKMEAKQQRVNFGRYPLTVTNFGRCLFCFQTKFVTQFSNRTVDFVPHNLHRERLVSLQEIFIAASKTCFSIDMEICLFLFSHFFSLTQHMHPTHTIIINVIQTQIFSQSKQINSLCICLWMTCFHYHFIVNSSDMCLEFKLP